MVSGAEIQLEPAKVETAQMVAKTVTDEAQTQTGLTLQKSELSANVSVTAKSKVTKSLKISKTTELQSTNTKSGQSKAQPPVKHPKR